MEKSITVLIIILCILLLFYINELLASVALIGLVAVITGTELYYHAGAVTKNNENLLSSNGDKASTICMPKFTMLQFIGEGGFGKVYRVKDTKLNKVIALKVAKLDFIQSEIDNIKKLKSVRNVPEFLGEGKCTELEDKNYYSMDYYPLNMLQFISQYVKPGKSSEQKPTTNYEFFTIIFEMIYTLYEFRKLGFRHRDIKTENIMIDLESEPRSYDLGSGKTIKLRSKMRPVFIDFNESASGDTPDKLIELQRDIMAVQGIIIEELYENIDDDALTEKDIEVVGELAEKISEDDFTPEYALSVANLVANHINSIAVSL